MLIFSPRLLLVLAVGSLALYLGWSLLPVGPVKAMPSRPPQQALPIQTVTVAASPVISVEQALGDTISAGLYRRLQRKITVAQTRAKHLAQQLAPSPGPGLYPVTLALVAAAPAETGAGGTVVLPANSYSLIPLEGSPENRPAAAHGDLNLKLRDPQPIVVDLTLVEINGSGLDPDAPNLAAIFKPDFVQAYTVHDWDWGCNCKGSLLHQPHLVLLGLRTTPGEPVFIPPRQQNVYQGKYYATLLYASEDSLTFVYTRAGSVAAGYTIHYLGLQTDPNLLTLFRQSRGSQLPGLTLHTPVGTASSELIVAIRDNGTFLDARSRHDWWK